MCFDFRSFAVAAMASASVLALTAGAAEAQSAILQQPTLSATQVAFVYGGDLWTVPRAGGRAQRLTVGVGVESGPVFSPDGRTLAFTGEYDGNIDVYTVPVAGGLPRRITYHPGNDAAVGWSPVGAGAVPIQPIGRQPLYPAVRRRRRGRGTGGVASALCLCGPHVRQRPGDRL